MFKLDFCTVCKYIIIIYCQPVDKHDDDDVAYLGLCVDLLCRQQRQKITRPTAVGPVNWQAQA